MYYIFALLMTTCSVDQSVLRPTLWWIGSNKLEVKSKENIVALFELYFHHFSGNAKEIPRYTWINIVYVLALIRTLAIRYYLGEIYRSWDSFRPKTNNFKG